VLALMLTLVWYSIHLNNSMGVVYPPTKNPCPDTWIADASGNCIIPTMSNIGNLSPAAYQSIPGYLVNPNGKAVINFNDIAWASTGMTPTCSQKLWANSNNVIWDTVSNYNQC
jgi:hypothetical protein